MALLFGVLSAFLVAGAGGLGLYLSGHLRGPASLGLAPAAGVAGLAVLTAWGRLIHLPETIQGIMIVAIGVAGLGLAIKVCLLQDGGRRCTDRLAVTMLACAFVIPILVLAQAVSIRAGVPDYIHDGATHAELVTALRSDTGIAGYDWYPVGFHAPAAALLSLVPEIDSGTGVVAWAVGLSLLAPLAAFGFTTAVWHDARLGAAAAVLQTLTYSFPYAPHLYSVWPMAAGFLLMVGLWTIALDYIARPDVRVALLGGALACGVLLTHGTEVYSVAIALAVVAVARWKSVALLRVAAHVGLALVAALLLTLPYLPVLGGWAAAGGAVAVGESYYDFRHLTSYSDPIQEMLFWSSAVSSGLLVDLPFRLALLGVGIWVAFRQRAARFLIVLCLMLSAFVAIFRYADVAPVRTIYALTLPWGVDDRLLSTLPIPLATLGALGLGSLARALALRSRSPNVAGVTSLKWQRNARRLQAFGLAFGAASVFLVGVKFSLQTSGIVTYSAGDATVMGWLRQHARADDLLLNDGSADAGIWAPYKGNVPIVMPRTRGGSPGGPEQLLRANLAGLDSRADVRAAACTLGVTYVFRGEGISPSEYREFPPLDELRRISALEEVFHSGDAAIFRTHLNCAT